MSTDPLQAALRPVDPLGDVLHALRMTGTFYCRSELTAPWGVDLPAMPDSLMFHAVLKGSCSVCFPRGDTCTLGESDFVLLPHGQGHCLKDVPDSQATNIFDLHRSQVSARYEVLRYGGGGSASLIICGAVALGDPVARRVVSLLPKMIVVRAADTTDDWLLTMIRMMTAEAQSLRPGSDTIITRVSDILVVHAIRHWFANEPLAQTGWLGALQDERIGRAIALVHRDPTHPWTVEEMAHKAGVSRSGFAARFQQLVGETPMQYVRTWRFQVAEHWLKETEMSLAEIADQLGYQSESAFHRAFRKAAGRTPGEVRQRSRG